MNVNFNNGNLNFYDVEGAPIQAYQPAQYQPVEPFSLKADQVRRPLNRIADPNYHSWTFRLKQTALAVLGCTAFFAIGKAALNRDISYPFPTIPLCLAAAAPLVYSFLIEDLDNPVHHAKAEKTASEKPLSETLKQRGWEEIFKNFLIPSTEFPGKYREFLSTKSFKEILEINRAAMQGLMRAKTGDVYDIPVPFEWKGRFDHETENMSFKKIIDNYSFTDLVQSGVLSDAEFHDSFNNFLYQTPFLEAVSYYQKAIKTLDSAQLTPTSKQLYSLVVGTRFTGKFIAETRGLSLGNIVEKYKSFIQTNNIPKVIDDQLFDLLKQTSQIIQDAHILQAEITQSQSLKQHLAAKEHLKEIQSIEKAHESVLVKLYKKYDPKGVDLADFNKKVEELADEKTEKIALKTAQYKAMLASQHTETKLQLNNLQKQLEDRLASLEQRRIALLPLIIPA